MAALAAGAPASWAMVLVVAYAGRATFRSRRATLVGSRPSCSLPHWEVSEGGLVLVGSLVLGRVLVLLLVVACVVLRLGQLRAAPRQHCRRGAHHQERRRRPAAGSGRSLLYPSLQVLLDGRGR